MPAVAVNTCAPEVIGSAANASHTRIRPQFPAITSIAYTTAHELPTGVGIKHEISHRSSGDAWIDAVGRVARSDNGDRNLPSYREGECRVCSHGQRSGFWPLRV